MKNPSELAYPDKLPDDLKLLLKQQKVPVDDPLIAVLAWHWMRTNESRDVIQENRVKLEVALDERREAIQDDRLKLEAALDERLKKMVDWAEALKFLNGHLEKLSEVLSEKPLGISQQITRELTQPIAGGAALVKQLSIDIGGLLSDVDESRKHLRWSHIVTGFLSGFAIGTLMISWIYSHIFLH
jgi:hypothetical protein